MSKRPFDGAVEELRRKIGGDETTLAFPDPMRAGLTAGEYLPELGVIRLIAEAPLYPRAILIEVPRIQFLALAGQMLIADAQLATLGRKPASPPAVDP